MNTVTNEDKLNEAFTSFCSLHTNKSREQWLIEFKNYCKEYPNISKLRLISEFEDRSGDLRNSRLCAEKGYCP